MCGTKGREFESRQGHPCLKVTCTRIHHHGNIEELTDTLDTQHGLAAPEHRGL